MIQLHSHRLPRISIKAHEDTIFLWFSHGFPMVFSWNLMKKRQQFWCGPLGFPTVPKTRGATRNWMKPCCDPGLHGMYVHGIQWYGDIMGYACIHTYIYIYVYLYVHIYIYIDFELGTSNGWPGNMMTPQVALGSDNIFRHLPISW